MARGALLHTAFSRLERPAPGENPRSMPRPATFAIMTHLGSLVPLATLVWRLAAFPDLAFRSDFEIGKYEFVALALIDHGTLYLPAEANGGVVGTSDRMPGYPVFLAAVFELFGRQNYLAVALIQCLLAGLTVTGVAAMAAKIDRRWLWPAAILASLWPNMTFRAAAMTPETFFTFWLVWGAFFCVAAATARRPLNALLAAGVCLAVAYLTRPALTLLPVLLVPALVFLFRQTLRISALRAFGLSLVPFVVMGAATVPLLIHNAALYGRPVLQTQAGDHLLYWAYACLTQPLGCGDRNADAVRHAQAVLEQRMATLTEAERANRATLSAIKQRVAVELILDIPPQQLLRAGVAATVKLLVHPFLSETYQMFRLETDFLSDMPGETAGKRLLNYLSYLLSSPRMTFWLAALGLLLASRLVQAWGLVVALREPAYRPHVLVAAAFFLALLATATASGQGSVRLRAPMEPWLVLATLFALGPWLARLWASRTRPAGAWPS